MSTAPFTRNSALGKCNLLTNNFKRQTILNPSGCVISPALQLPGNAIPTHHLSRSTAMRFKNGSLTMMIQILNWWRFCSISRKLILSENILIFYSTKSKTWMSVSFLSASWHDLGHTKRMSFFPYHHSLLLARIKWVFGCFDPVMRNDIVTKATSHGYDVSRITAKWIRSLDESSVAPVTAKSWTER